jgi:DNA invertase Pin-like site-specific DNA recombinase
LSTIANETILMRKIGYLRVSRSEQRPDRQINGLRELCDELYIEIASGARLDRPVYRDVIARLAIGDTLVVWDLDRAYRSASQALNDLEALHRRGISILIVNQAIDTTTPTGVFIFTVMAGLATFERQTLSRRTREGLAAARRRGRVLGRPRKLDDTKLRELRGMLARGETTKTAAAAQWGVARWTLTRSLKRLSDASS